VNHPCKGVKLVGVHALACCFRRAPPACTPKRGLQRRTRLQTLQENIPFTATLLDHPTRPVIEFPRLPTTFPSSGSSCNRFDRQFRAKSFVGDLPYVGFIRCTSTPPAQTPVTAWGESIQDVARSTSLRTLLPFGDRYQKRIAMAPCTGRMSVPPESNPSHASDRRRSA
jgi:hypothetical protein